MKFPDLRDQPTGALISVQYDLLGDIRNIDDGTTKEHVPGERKVLHALVLQLDYELRFRNKRRRPVRVPAAPRQSKS